MICNVNHTKCLKTSIPESSLLHSSSNMCDPCPAVQADPYAHVQKDKNVSRPKRIEQVQKQPEEEGQHHLFLYAVAADCVQCVKYWIHRGMDIEKETKHMKYTAMDWAEWSAATKVEQLLKEQLNANQNDGDESSEMDDTPGGVWRAVDVKMEEDEDVESEICDLQITNGDEYAFWSSAMSGNWIDTKEWCEVTSMIPPGIAFEGEAGSTADPWLTTSTTRDPHGERLDEGVMFLCFKEKHGAFVESSSMRVSCQVLISTVSTFEPQFKQHHASSSAVMEMSELSTQ